MNGVRPLALILVAITGCMALASVWSGPADWKVFLPAEIAESAAPQQSCVDDLSIQNLSVYDRGNGYVFQDPPNYADGDDIAIFYDVVNSSCREVTVTVVLTGSVSGATIHDADGSSAPCLDGCTIAAGATQQSNAQWDLGKHPNATGEKVVATVTIDAPSDFSDADTSNNSDTSADAINIVNEVSSVDIAVKSVTASKTAALIGDDIDFTVTISNEGDSETDATVTLDHGDETDELDSTTVSALAADGESTVTLSWDTDEAEAGAHNLRVLAASEGDGNSANDSKTVTVTLREPSTDVAVNGVQASSTEAVIGDTVDFTISLKNDGDIAIAPTVSLYKGDDTEALGSATAATIAAGGTATVTISWDTDDVEAGTYSLRAVATVADDDDSTNDSVTASLILHDPVDVELSLTSPIASSAVSGNSVSVPFTVTNSGENDTGEVQISLYVTEVGQDQTTEDTTADGTDDQEEEEATATANVATLAVDESTSGTLTWATADANVGDYDILIVATTSGDTDETNNSVSASIEIRNWLVLKSASPQNAVAIVGDNIEFTAQVENVGSGQLANLTVGLYEPNVDGALGSATISSVATGSTADATIEWDTSGRDVDVFDLLVAAGADGQDPDRDDSQWVNIDLRNPIALSSAIPASTDNLAASSVTINVQVLNESGTEVTDVAVDLYVRTSEQASGTATIESILAGETIETSLEWDTTDIEPGDHQLKIVASVPDHNGDSNDAALLTVALRAPVMAVELTAAIINRNVAAIGQTLEVVATVTNHGEAPVRVPVGLYLVGQLQQTTAASTGTSSLIAPGSSSEVVLQWDSTGESVGTHTLKAAAELPEDTTTDDNEDLLEIELFRSAFDGIEEADGCVEDVRVKVTDIRDLAGQKRSPPNYYVGENLRVAYRVYNFSCQTDITLALTMNGPEDQAVNDASALCFSHCVVPFGAKAEGEIAWIIPTLPALSDGTIGVATTIVSPSDFVDVNEANNAEASTDRINIVHPDEIVLHLGEQKDDKVSINQTLTEPEFGVVDLRLASVHPLQATLPFTADTIEVTVEVANDGPATEPATIRFLLEPKDGTEQQELYRHTMVIPAGQSKTENLAVPVGDVTPGAHTIEVLLSAARDESPENNTGTVEINRSGPAVNVEMTSVVVSPDVLVLGDQATINATIQNNSEVALSLTLELYVDDASEPTVTKTLNELASDGQSAEQIAWRVPASTNMLGQHVLKLGVSSEVYGDIAIANVDIILHIDAEIVGIRTSPEETAMQGEEIAIEVEVQNNGPATVNVPIVLHFPSETKSSEMRSPSVLPKTTEIAQFTWKTRDYDIGEHTLTANVPGEHNVATGQTAVELQFVLRQLLITATILDVLANPENPSVGEPVTITVTVRNEGPIAANIPITLHFPSGDKQPETRSPRLDPGEIVAVTFDWLTSNYAAGAQQFLVELAAVGSPVRPFTVDLLPTVIDVAIVGIGAYPVDTAMVGETVEVWIEVRNDGPAAINVPVQLAFPSAGKRPETRSPRVDPGGIARVSFDWKTSNYGVGVHILRATILLRDNVTLGPTSAELRFLLTPLVVIATIVDVVVSPESPRVGEPVTITVTVRNDGRVSTNIPVTLHFPSNEKQPETRRPRVEPGAVGSASFTWRTSRYEPGIHDFRAEVASDPPSSQRFEIELLPPIVNVAILGIGSDPADTAVKGQAVKIWVDVINNGPSALEAPVQLSFPSDEKKPERKSTQIEPGEIARVKFTWKTANYDIGVHILTVTLLAEYNTTELDTSATIQIRLISAQLIASIVEISWSPKSPVVGEPVTITVTLRNDGRISTNIPVTLHFPSNGKQPETRRPRVEPGAVGSASFTWRTSRYKPGMHHFRVEVASDPPSAQRFEIELLPPIVNVAILGIGSDPADTAVKGQAVKIWVDVINNGPSALEVPVQLTFPSNEKKPERKSPRVEPGEIARVEFTLKTANYDIGVHILTVTLLAEYNTTELDTSATIQIRLISAQLIAAIVEISWSPKSPVVGEPVAITVSVRNDGLVTSSIPVTLYFPSGGKQPETRRPRVAAGAIGSASFTWRTSRYEPGDHIFRVVIVGMAGAVRDFVIELLPPTADFAVVDFQPPDALYPIVKGDWVQITAMVRNLGPYASRGTVTLLNETDRDTMYEQSVSLEPGEFKDVEFIWKTLRYPVGKYDLMVRVDTEYDTDPDNDYSDQVQVRLLTDRDITVGFGDGAQPAVFADRTSRTILRATPQYSDAIQVTGGVQSPVDGLISPATELQMGVAPRPMGGKYDSARMYWQWRSAQISAWECARYQKVIEESQPRPILCPEAGALVR